MLTQQWTEFSLDSWSSKFVCLYNVFITVPFLTEENEIRRVRAKNWYMITEVSRRSEANTSLYRSP